MASHATRLSASDPSRKAGLLATVGWPTSVAALVGPLLWSTAATAQTEPAAMHGAPEPSAGAPGPTSDEVEREAPGDSLIVPTLHALGVMTGMRIGAAILWPEPFADLRSERVGQSYADAYSHWPRWDSSRPPFEWDGDRWYINVVGHGLFGSELYLRARVCRRSLLEALAFTAVGSAVWEYGFEASAVRPSALDLWYTPVAGMLLGEARYLGWQAASGIRDRGWRSVLSVVFDPLGEFERALGTAC